ncbi:MAG TPA: CYTH domain-containing protein [Candidatus Binataceae bacterium]|nr:CYTH domain-containing protein [Candidatus Binataceae bacterium]
MPIEIERKFLVADEGWRKLYTKSARLRDGLIATSNDCKVRVRMYERRATITIKTKRAGSKRSEFEYEIPVEDAEELISFHCGENVLAKTRYYVPHQGFTWEVDVYEGILSGVILAEIELESADIKVPAPHWIGREVTDDPQYKKINMHKARLGQPSLA